MIDFRNQPIPVLGGPMIDESARDIPFSSIECIYWRLKKWWACVLIGGDHAAYFAMLNYRIGLLEGEVALLKERLEYQEAEKEHK